MKVDAIVLAGGKFKDSTEYKAFVKIGGQTLLEKTLEALKGCPQIGQIIISSVPEGQKIDTGYPIITDSGSLINNINLALNQVKTSKTLLVASDMPFIKSSVITDFIESCERNNEADICYPIIPKEKMINFSKSKRTFFKLDKTYFTGGNIIMMKTSLFKNHSDLAEMLYASRKKPLKIVSLLGPFFLVKFLIGKLRIKDTEKKASKILNAKAKIVVINKPEIGVDIDKKSDFKQR